MTHKNAYKKLCSLFATLLFAFFLSATSYAAPGDLDPTFGTDGKVTTTFNFAVASDVALQADGKIVVAGSNRSSNGTQIVLARYHTNGSLDASFGNGGRVYTSVGNASAIAIQADGRIVVAGFVCVISPTCDFTVVRFTTNGSLDTSFDSDGRVTVDMGNGDFANDLALQSDGKIIVVGRSGVIGSSNFAFAVARLNPDGSLDASFDGDGRVITSLGTFSDSGATAVALQPDGKIVATGQSGSGNFATADFALVRYNPDGSLDASFDGDGKVITAVSSGGDFASDVAVQSDGKIVAVGGYSHGGAVVRYNDNGSLDASFDGDGIVVSPGYYAISVAIQSNGKIVVAGGNGDEFALVRYNPNGSLDNSFGGDGTVTTSFGDFGYGGANSLAIQPDGKIIAAGSWVLDGEFAYFAVARYIGDAVASNRKFFDFDGDGKADVSVFRPSDGVWYLNRSTQGFSATQFGLSTDRITPADFDGDGRTDIAVFRDGTWYWLNSSNGSFDAIQFGQASDVPVPADFTGDGRAELAVYRGGVWFTLNLQNNQFNAVQFGISSDKPVVADYDGDGRADYAVYRDGIWYLLQSTQGFAAIQFGISTDKLVPADYDGDGRTDIAVYRPSEGNWYLQRSTAGFGAVNFGTGEDIPAAGDYDGDGKTDVAVFRPSTGVWHLLRSSSGLTATQFGLTNDIPVPSAFVP